MSSVKDTLIGARALIADIEHWTQGNHAIENTGARVDPLADAAYAYCADGALCRAARGFTGAEGFSNARYEEAYEVLKAASQRLFGHNPVNVNDGDYWDAELENASEEDFPKLCHERVLEVFDDAIAHAA